MTNLTRNDTHLTRRRFLTTAAYSATAIAAGGIYRPAISRAADRPLITHGVQSGDVSVHSGVVWARADRAARMLVEISTTDSFKAIRSAVCVDALPETDFTAKALIEGLPAGQRIFYRISFQDHASPTLIGESQIGQFQTAPSDRRPVSFVWSGDVAGQGGVSTNRAAACADLQRCTKIIRISSSIPATASTPIVLFPPS